MGRKLATATPDPELPIVNGDTVELMQRQAAGHELALQAAIGDMTAYSQEAAVARLRGLMAAGAQVMLELGRTLIQMRENEPDNTFAEILGRVGLDSRVAYRAMQASRKFLLSLPEGNRDAFGNLGRGKLYELLVLDEDQTAELASGGSVLGLTLDDVDTMSTSELRRALRSARAQRAEEIEVKDRLIAAKNEKLDKAEEQLERLQHGGRDVEKRLMHEREQHAIKTFQDASLELLGAVQRFDLAVADCLAEPTEARTTLAEQTVTWLFQRINQIATDRGMPVDFAAVVDPLSLSAEA